MQSKDIVVGNSYAYQPYGDYQPLAWRLPAWQHRAVYKATVDGRPQAGQVLISVDYGEDGPMRMEVSTRRLFNTWGDHLSLLRQAEESRQKHLDEQRRKRDEKASRVLELEAIFTDAGLDYQQTAIRPPYGIDAETGDIIDHLVELGFIVTVDLGFDGEEVWLRGDSHAGYYVVSPAGCATQLYTDGKLALTAEEILAVYLTGMENE